MLSISGLKMANIHAFSLIELMVVVAIVGTLSIVAVPSYQTQMMRSRIAALMPLADSMKVSVMEEHSYGTVFGLTEEDIIAANATSKPQYLDNMVRTAYGCIQIQYDTSALGLDSGSELSLVLCPVTDNDSGLVSWNCGYSVTTDVDYAKYMPGNCRQVVTQDTEF